MWALVCTLQNREDAFTIRVVSAVVNPSESFLDNKQNDIGFTCTYELLVYSVTNCSLCQSQRHSSLAVSSVLGAFILYNLSDCL